MYIFKDRRGRTWITAEGLKRYFGIHLCEQRRYFYRYDYFCREGYREDSNNRRRPYRA